MIDELSDQEKSVMLARAMGDDEAGDIYKVVYDPGSTVMAMLYGMVDDTDAALNVYVHNLYDSTNMALAWRVLNWWHTDAIAPPDQWLEFNNWWKDGSYDDNHHLHLWGQPDAQSAWLDKILSLCIEAGLVETE